MSAFTVARLEELAQRGCATCGATHLRFRAYVDGALPMLGGEPVGKLGWTYDGERFVDGVFEVTCAACGATEFTDDACPRCAAPGGLATALATESALPAPAACPRCGGEELRLFALVPARVEYRGARADKARTHCEPLDPGFHGLRVECKPCRGVVAAASGACPLCGAAART
jgi:hypothetical protein